MAGINQQSAAAREAARRSNGEFGEQHLADPGNDMLGDNPLANREPSDIDAEIAELTYASYSLEDRRQRTAETLHRYARDKKHYRWSRLGDWTMTDEQAAEAAREKLASMPADDWDSRTARRELDSYDEYSARLDKLREQIATLDAEYERRGRWTREFVVQNADGHSHNSPRCSTLHKGRRPTRLYWMTDYSGMDKYEVMKAAGWRICDVCHPIDPSDPKDPRNRDDWRDPTKRGTSMYTPDDLERDKARQEREAARIAREQKKLAGSPTCDGQPIRIDKGWSTETFTSERSALIWATDHLADLAQKAERPENFAPHMDDYHARASASLETLLDTVALKRVAAAHEVLGARPADVFAAIAYKHGVDEPAITEQLAAEVKQTRSELRAELEAKGAAKWAKTRREWDRHPHQIR